MTTVSTEDPQFQRAIQACAVALRRMADYEIEPSLHRRMQVLGERKEFLSQEEQEELLALVDFAHKRTIEKLNRSTRDWHTQAATFARSSAAIFSTAAVTAGSS